MDRINFLAAVLLKEIDESMSLGPFEKFPIATVGGLIVAVVVLLRSGPNTFSMHELYRNRLVRAFLGASKRQPTKLIPFIDFSSEDDLLLFDLGVRRSERSGGMVLRPFPIWCATVNVTDSSEIGLQERKAVSFVFTPLHCGYEITSADRRTDSDKAAGGYAPSKDHGTDYNLTDKSYEPEPLTVGTVVATSGAAFSSNAGASTKPERALLLTLLGLRLGRWFPNPGKYRSQDQGGVQLTFGVSLRAESTENADLDPVSAGRSDLLSTQLSFGLTSTTAISSLSQDGGLQIRGSDGPSSASDGVTAPTLALSYGRQGANADLSLSAAWRETDLTQDREIDDFDTGSGTRQTSSVSLGLNWGTAAPLGFGLTAGLTDVAYQDSPGNVDSQTTRLGLSMRADLTEVLSLTGGLRGSRFEDDGGTTRDTVGLDLGLTLARPFGELGLSLSQDVTEDGDRQSLRFSHSLELPRGTLGYNLGFSRDVAGNLHPVAGIDWQRQLPRGQISLSYDRSVTANSDDEETLRDKLSFDYGTELTASTRLSLALALARQENTLSGLTTTNGVGAVTRGLAEARGDAAIVLSAEISHTPWLIRDLVASWRADSVLAYVWRDADTGNELQMSWSRGMFEEVRSRPNKPLPPELTSLCLFDREVVDYLVYGRAAVSPSDEYYGAD